MGDFIFFFVKNQRTFIGNISNKYMYFCVTNYKNELDNPGTTINDFFIIYNHCAIELMLYLYFKYGK